jgi:hypothetical protein
VGGGYSVLHPLLIDRIVVDPIDQANTTDFLLLLFLSGFVFESRGLSGRSSAIP